MQVTWNILKQRATEKRVPLQFVEEDTRYNVSISEASYFLFTYIPKTIPANVDQEDFEDNFKGDANAAIVTKVDSVFEGPLLDGNIVVGASAVEAKVGASAVEGRSGLFITPVDRTVWFGGSSVTTSSGTPIFKNRTMFIAAKDTAQVYLIAAEANSNVRIVEVK